MTKGNFLKIVDTVQLSLLSPDLVKVKDNYEGAFKPQDPNQHVHPTGMGSVPAADQQNVASYQGLLIRIAATHAGIITRNNGFYLPDKMKTGAATFLQDFAKPVLLHHNDEQDPVGRVVEAQYVDTSGAIADKYNGLVIKNKKGKKVGTITDTLIKDFVSDKMPFGQQIDIVRSLLTDSILADQSYEGLGHIQLLANVVDPEAIKKLLDGRYLTVSTGASTDAAICSICRTDWTDDGRCEHTPGAVYDGAKCFIIAGSLKYDECSFVNKPADKHAKVLELHYNGIQDSVQVAEESYNRLYEVNLEFPQYSEKSQEDKMAGENAKTDTPTTEDPKTEELQDSVQTTEETIEDPTQVEDNTSTEEETVEDSTESTEETVEDSTTDEETQEESVEDFVVRVLDSDELSDEDEEKLYNLMWDEAKAAFGEELLEDAKLSTAKRKSLPKSSFCGPNRSFPVNDCAHVTAARRLIGRAKVSDSTKDKIMACVNRKAKALGCKSKQEDQVQDNVQSTNQDAYSHSFILRNILSALEENAYSKKDEEYALSDEEVKMLQDIIKRMATMVGKDAFVQSLYNEELAHDEQALLDEVTKHEETIGDLRDRLDASQKEYHLLFEDMEAMQSSLIDSKSQMRKEREEYLATLVALRDNKVEDQDFTKFSDNDLNTEITRTLEKVDMGKIVDKLGDGMSRIPTEGVENPVDTVQQGDNVQKNVGVQDLAKIEERFWHIRMKHGELAAEAFLKECHKKGYFPKDSK